MIRPLRGLYIKFQLWRRGYCTKHLEPKVFAGFYIFVCRSCQREEDAKKQAKRDEDARKLQRWLKELGQG